MRIAVTYNDGMIFEHFGHCECFAIYDYENSDVNKCTKTLVDCSDKHVAGTVTSFSSFTGSPSFP